MKKVLFTLLLAVVLSAQSAPVVAACTMGDNWPGFTTLQQSFEEDEDGYCWPIGPDPVAGDPCANQGACMQWATVECGVTPWRAVWAPNSCWALCDHIGGEVVIADCRH